MKIRVGVYPHYFEIPPYIVALDQSIFDFVGIEVDDIQSPPKVNGKDFDMIFTYILQPSQMPDFGNNPVIFAFEMNEFWEPVNYRIQDLISTLEQCDVVFGWMDHIRAAAQAMGKVPWDFPPLFHSDLRLGDFDLRRRELGLHAIRMFDWPDFQTTFLFVAANNFEYHFTVGPMRSQAYKEMQLKFDCLYPHDLLPYADLLKLLSTKCRALFQHTLRPSHGRMLLEAIQVGIPSIGSPTWYQQTLFPDLITNTLNEAFVLLSSDYETFESHVERAQRSYFEWNLGNRNAVESYNEYVLKCLEDVNK